MDTTAALLFTLYMIPVNLLDNVLRPFVFGRGLDVPVLVILIGVIGGTISQGITGCLGPIVLAVIWILLIAWIKEQEAAPTRSKRRASEPPARDSNFQTCRVQHLIRCPKTRYLMSDLRRTEIGSLARFGVLIRLERC